MKLRLGPYTLYVRRAFGGTLLLCHSHSRIVFFRVSGKRVFGSYVYVQGLSR